MKKSKIYDNVTNEAAELSCLISQLKTLNKTIYNLGTADSNTYDGLTLNCLLLTERSILSLAEKSYSKLYTQLCEITDGKEVTA
ncbi:MAG: hypothetical protein K2J73_02610 [Oscillospiraceae bacterium]|nr:hypothetical protein [Oscillospiraceae bacterium]